MDVKIDRKTKIFALQQDQERNDREERRFSFEARKAKSASCERQLASEELSEEEKDIFYAAALAD